MRSRLATLVDDGAQDFDPGAVTLVERLLARADRAPAKTQARLLERGASHLEVLAMRLRCAREEAAQHLEVLHERDPALAMELEARLASGEVRDVLRLARTRLEQRMADVDEGARRRLSMALETARARGLVVDGDLERSAEEALGDTRAEGDHLHALANRLGEALLDDAVETNAVMVGVCCGARAVPEQAVAGPYNATVIVGELLERLSVTSPRYLRVLVDGAKDIDAVLGAKVAAEDGVESRAMATIRG